ncbi:hypothetical protein H2199_007072 [Coniosporium tulheliwenetii]|uniref:Uncharacterized protein n=1 Tax=Coniosporium tulheliwenetii TaxID=3383036 RepID=A0ACC2YSM6_9PEZI|nr:hypothetical protein H2199_007072 [Cladosporium sp. JES 115]
MAAEFATTATAIQLADISCRLAKEIYSFTVALKDSRSELLRLHDCVSHLDKVLERAGNVAQNYQTSELQAKNKENLEALADGLKGCQTDLQSLKQLLGPPLDKTASRFDRLVTRLKSVLNDKETSKWSSVLDQRATAIGTLLSAIGRHNDVESYKRIGHVVQILSDLNAKTVSPDHLLPLSQQLSDEATLADQRHDALHERVLQVGIKVDILANGARGLQDGLTRAATAVNGRLSQLESRVAGLEGDKLVMQVNNAFPEPSMDSIDAMAYLGALATVHPLLRNGVSALASGVQVDISLEAACWLLAEFERLFADVCATAAEALRRSAAARLGTQCLKALPPVLALRSRIQYDLSVAAAESFQYFPPRASFPQPYTTAYEVDAHIGGLRAPSRSVGHGHTQTSFDGKVDMRSCHAKMDMHVGNFHAVLEGTHCSKTWPLGPDDYGRVSMSFVPRQGLGFLGIAAVFMRPAGQEAKIESILSTFGILPEDSPVFRYIEEGALARCCECSDQERSKRMTETRMDAHCSR